jgi:very-short-patch-repair endonuclease
MAEELHREMIDAERLLWSRLRSRQMGGHRFRRQVPIGPYIVDFACLAAKLVIEVDGSQHAEDLGCDARRHERIAADRSRVLRFWNHEVMRETEGVLETIWLALSRRPPHATRPPQAGRER